MGIFQTTLSKWKAGRSVPSVINLKALSKYFNVSVEYFLE
ncbi:helix-turn-helix domain-containing protein [Brotonthovivens ammoniilytica]|uniref:Helix-turn-helix domain-containing protein n=1 Tax=Brotonthovivens ammoniilytica TaxID=2981725 RepID=A0ABT2TMP0_9FIRM|nr:helix-turn-helix transcriptional regulator [Brotonthovivens ammoniilytica]MCU6763488.1 helix-turn-helix domain-containing protein [Brotonthovivens ammoniilytica]